MSKSKSQQVKKSSSHDEIQKLLKVEVELHNKRDKKLARLAEPFQQFGKIVEKCEAEFSQMNQRISAAEKRMQSSTLFPDIRRMDDTDRSIKVIKKKKTKPQAA